MSIFSRLKALGKGISFHTPGHQNRLNPLDGTEIPFVFPEKEGKNYISLAEKKAAEHYECREIRFLVNGSSIGVKSMIMSVGGAVIAPENRHPSVDEGAILSGFEPVFVQNEVNSGLKMPLTVKQIEEAYARHPEVKAVLVVSPDYYGFCADLPSIRAFCDKNGLKMLVDSAHGAHFASDKTIFPQSASAIADAANMSAHKTLSAYTQSAFLSINDVDLVEKIDFNLKLLGTTSPSYILMGGLEKAVEFEQKNAEKYALLRQKIDFLAQNIPFTRIKNDDPMRLVISAASKGMTGEQLYKKLIKNGIYAELYDDERVVFIITLSTKPKHIDRLRKVIASL